jgi:dihydrofolate synthase / folylpolyglutamate synthase
LTPRAPGATREAGWYGPPEGDPLAARLFPPLPGTVLWGLDRMQRIMAAVGSPHRAYPSLVVGGTNGKGSVATVWARVLEAAGFRVGLYTSPHLVDFAERIAIDGEPAPAFLLDEVAAELRSPIVKRQPSFFEATTALALTTFARADVDVAVLEVGLGGRLDAVNVVDPILTAVTNVGLEHQELLGPDHAAIAREKAGIFRAGVPAFTGATHPDALRVLAEEAAVLGIPLARVSPAPGESTLGGRGGHGAGTRMRLATRSWGPLELFSPLLGAHQRANVALAVRALEGLPPRLLPPRRAVEAGVAAARVPGRLQVEVEGPRRIVLDVAHNPDGVETLVRALDELAPPGPRVAVVGILSDKPVGVMLRTLAAGMDQVILTVPPSAPAPRRWDPEQVVRVLQEEGRAGESGEGRGGQAGGRFEAVPEFAAALARARALTEQGGTVVVTGSFHTVGAALELLRREGGRNAEPPEPLRPGSR